MSYTTPTPLLAFAGPMSTPTPHLAFGTPSNVPGRRGVAGLGEIDSSAALWIVGGGVLVLGLGWLVYRHVKRMDTIAEREGSAGLLKYHAGTAAISVGSQLASELISGGRYRQNRSRRRARRRR